MKRTVRSYRKDANQDAIVDALLRVGCCVQILGSIGAGCPDLLVGLRGRLYLLEVKDANGALTPAQKGWHKTWAGYASVVTSIDEALAAVGIDGANRTGIHLDAG